MVRLFCFLRNSTENVLVQKTQSLSCRQLGNDSNLTLAAYYFVGHVKLEYGNYEFERHRSNNREMLF